MTAERTPGDPVTIVFVDDDRATVHMAAAVLRGEGYTVIAGDSAAAAEAQIDRHDARVDLLVTDYVMPESDGRALADRLRAAFPGLPVLFVSAHAEERLVQEGLIEESFKKGAHFLQKPFGPDDLLRRVRAVLGGL